MKWKRYGSLTGIFQREKANIRFSSLFLLSIFLLYLSIHFCSHKHPKTNKLLFCDCGVLLSASLSGSRKPSKAKRKRWWVWRPPFCGASFCYKVTSAGRNKWYKLIFEQFLVFVKTRLKNNDSVFFAIFLWTRNFTLMDTFFFSCASF